MQVLKKNKYLVIILSCMLVLLFIALWAIKSLIMPNENQSEYGNRLEGIENVRINNDRMVIITNKIEDNEKVNDANIYLKGRIIDIIVDVKKNVDFITSKSIVENIMVQFSEEEKKYYDFQAYIRCNDEENEIYPIIGYKHKTSLNFSWTNNS